MEELVKFEQDNPELFRLHKSLHGIKLEYNYKYSTSLPVNIYSHDGVNTTLLMNGKLVNLYHLAKDINGDIMELEFDGHTTLTFLYANPKVKVYIFDECNGLYEKKCIGYLNSVFDNRVILVKGNITTSLSYFNDLSKYISIFMINAKDLQKAPSYVEKCFDIGLKSSILVVNNCSSDITRHCYDALYNSRKIFFKEPKTRIMDKYCLFGIINK